MAGADERVRGEPVVRCPTEAIARRPTSTSRGSTRASSGPCSRPAARDTTAECVAKRELAKALSSCWILANALVDARHHRVKSARRQQPGAVNFYTVRSDDYGRL